VARSFGARLRGLLGRAGLPAGTGLLLTDCRSIHMCFMRFAIDAVFLDADLCVRKIAAALAPWRFAAADSARHVLELPAGAAATLGLEPGRRLRVMASSTEEVLYP